MCSEERNQEEEEGTRIEEKGCFATGPNCTCAPTGITSKRVLSAHTQKGSDQGTGKRNLLSRESSIGHPKQTTLVTPPKKLPKSKRNDSSSSSDGTSSPDCSLYARMLEKKAQLCKARQAKLPKLKDDEKSDSKAEPFEMPKCEGEESDDAVHKVQTLLSQESEQDPNAAVAMSNPDSDSDACSSKLPCNAIGLKSSKKKKKAIESDEESEDASACANRLLDSDYY